MPSTPFAPPPAPPSSAKKAIAPISANAFGFSLATPSKPSLAAHAIKTPRRSLSRDLIAPSSERAPGPRPSEASSSRTATVRLSETPLRTIKKEEDDTPRRAQIRLGDLSNPLFLPHPSTTDSERKGKRKLNEALNGDSPFRARPPPTDPRHGKELRGVSDLQEGVSFETIQEYSEAERIKAEEEEGVGVSPRRIKGISKWGKTPASLSKRLTDHLSAQTSAITLFYTSLQHTLAPPRPPPTRPTRPGIPQPNLPVPIKVENAPSLLSHIRTAPLRLRLTSPVRGRTQYAHMWLCQVRQWPIEAPKVDHQGEDIVDDRGTPGEVLCVFQNLPAECPRIGLDPRLLASRYNDGQPSQRGAKRWEVGVWGPWSEADMVTDIILAPEIARPAEPAEDELGEEVDMADTGEDRQDGRVVEERPGDGRAPAAEETGEVPEQDQPERDEEEALGEKRITKVLFASRYLIAER